MVHNIQKITCMELHKCDDVIVVAVYGDNYWTCGLKKHDGQCTNKKDKQEKKTSCGS